MDDPAVARAVMSAIVWGIFFGLTGCLVAYLKRSMRPGSRLRRFLLWPHG